MADYRDKAKEREYIRLATHEASHCAYDLAMPGWVVSNVFIDSKRMAGGVEVSYVKQAREVELEFALKRIGALMAGFAGEQRFRCAEGPQRTGKGTDHDAAMQIALEAACGDRSIAMRFIAQGRRLAAEKVDQLNKQIDAIFRGLLRSSGYLGDARLTGQEAQALFQRVDSVQHCQPSTVTEVVWVPKAMTPEKRRWLRQTIAAGYRQRPASTTWDV